MLSRVVVLIASKSLLLAKTAVLQRMLAVAVRVVFTAGVGLIVALIVALFVALIVGLIVALLRPGVVVVVHGRLLPRLLRLGLLAVVVPPRRLIGRALIVRHGGALCF